MKKQADEAKPRTVRITDAVWKDARKKAKQDGRTVSNWVAMLIQSAVNPPGRTIMSQI